jgi:hypothetical protein
MHNLLKIIALLCVSPLSQAQLLNYWQCRTLDSTNKEWVVENKYKKVAINRAFERCKKESTDPISCKTSKRSCESFVNGLSTTPMWLCTALDRNAEPWVSLAYPNKYDAALGARDYCIENSDLPYTCYINLVTCKNINSG